MGTTIDQLLRRIQAAYANNSYLYEFFEKKASGKEIVDFMYWDAVQSPFNEYLRLWLPKAHPSVLPALNKHIAEEENEGHSALFRKMLQLLMEKFPGKLPQREASILSELNYPFSKECAEQESFAYFCGSFLTTEIMSAKRCGQIYAGLLRNGVTEGSMEYLRLHTISDQNHAREVEHGFVQPILAAGVSISEIEFGVNDRLQRSEKYLRWYEAKFIL